MLYLLTFFVYKGVFTLMVGVFFVVANGGNRLLKIKSSL